MDKFCFKTNDVLGQMIIEQMTFITNGNWDK